MNNNTEEEDLKWEDEDPAIPEVAPTTVDDSKKKELEEYFQKIDESEPKTEPTPSTPKVDLSTVGWGDETVPFIKEELDHPRPTTPTPVTVVASSPTSRVSSPPTTPLDNEKKEPEDWDSWE